VCGLPSAKYTENPSRPARAQGAEGALDEVGESLAGALDDGVLRVVRVADPVAGGGMPEQAASADGADVLELEALGGVFAADLVQAFGF
jgi:hypothetical protein